MKTTTDNHIDKLLHEAMKQRAAKVPPLADDFAEKVLGSLGSLTPRPLQKKRELKFWPLVVAACMVGFVVIFLAPPKSPEEQSPLALEEPEVNSQEPIADSQLSTPLKGEMEGASQQPTVVKPKRTPKRKRVVPQEPQEEPLLAEAETVEEFPTEAAYQEFLDKMRKPSPSSYATQAQEIRQRGEQVTQYVAMLNQQIKTEQQYVEY
jgi:hypothetical protein